MWQAIAIILQILATLFKDKIDERVLRRKKEEQEAINNDNLYKEFKEALKTRDTNTLDSILRRMRESRKA